MKIRRPSEKTLRILKMIALGTLIIGIGAAPSPRAIARVFRELKISDSPKNRKWIKRKLYGLHEQQYVSIRDDSYTLSEVGQRVIAEHKLWALSIPQPKKWDGVWHIVVFDIPQEKSNVRIPFIRHLQNLGLIFYQRSVWIHPFPCEDEVREIADFQGILPFVSFIKATHVDGSHALRKYFKL
ncbi:hypothetical protein HYW59_04395 [Candidatus Kaiserbacteria bacterium]|nr:hypothetical protein [Candidatus Kaiserbacteria bacterium]